MAKSYLYDIPSEHLFRKVNQSTYIRQFPMVLAIWFIASLVILAILLITLNWMFQAIFGLGEFLYFFFLAAFFGLGYLLFRFFEKIGERGLIRLRFKFLERVSPNSLVKGINSKRPPIVKM